MSPTVEPPASAQSWADMLSTLRRNALLILSGGFACAVAAGLWSWHAPARFEATASLMMAHVLGDPVENPSVLVEKVKSGTYFSKAAWAACGVSEAADPGRRLADKIRPISNRNAPFVGVSFTAQTTDKATSCVAQVVSEVTLAQDKMAQPTLVAKRAQLDEMKRRLNLMHASGSAAEKLQLTSEINHQQFAMQSLWLSAAVSRHEAERDLARRIADLEIKLTAPLTHPARLVSAIYAPPIPLGPPVWALVLGAFAAGVVVSALAVGVRAQFKSGRRDGAVA